MSRCTPPSWPSRFSVRGTDEPSIMGNDGSLREEVPRRTTGGRPTPYVMWHKPQQPETRNALLTDIDEEIVMTSHWLPSEGGPS